ncbi:hypothetical protein [Phosphitispora fastidiosa]|uniref:hypothetical protein n=1 Tax=Phosphitispora fastidiosa TaxID=2837202 RepID=UPI001E3B1D28|nr:hypothetical protein [Phosphitispora fastidiosa]MBU7005893.1 HD superfamily phosphohydrolase [Phosphitispora fastidiosa]
MIRWKYKILRDNVHGYIQVPKPFIEEIVDTGLFQRLRYIEQTGMRTLYPSARHDRFIHSLGTFHLGVKAFEAFRGNVKMYYSDKGEDRNHYFVFTDKEENENFWDKCGVLFSIACLIHDCGHSPFSHTLEYLYDIYVTKDDSETLNDKLLKEYNSSSFRNDFDGIGKPHERMSALLAKTEFGTSVKKIIQDEFNDYVDYDLEFIARAIIGCKYKNIESRENQIKNCIIQLLNSQSIDVDGLDYIVRDARLSGVDNAALDVDRLLSSLTIVEKTHFSNCTLSDELFDNPILDGLLVGKVTGTILGDIIADNFRGSIKGHIYLNGKARIKNSMKAIDGYVKMGGYDLEGLQSTKEVVPVEINANLTENLILETGNFRCQKNIGISGDNDAKIQMPSIYLNGRITGQFSGEVLGHFKCENSRVEVVLAFHKNSLSVLRNVIYSRNYEYLWIYAHHKVVYYSNYLLIELLRISAKYLINAGENIRTDRVLTNMLSMLEPIEYNGHIFFRTTDYDIIALFKECYLNADSCPNSFQLKKIYKEFFTRNYKKSVWKSYAEYNLFFRDWTVGEKEALLAVLKDNMELKGNTNFGYFVNDWPEEFKKYGMDDVVWVSAEVKMKDFDIDNTFILLKDKPMRLKDVSTDQDLNYSETIPLFYLYYSAEEPISKTNREKLISFLKAKAREKEKVS